MNKLIRRKLSQGKNEKYIECDVEFYSLCFSAFFE